MSDERANDGNAMHPISSDEFKERLDRLCDVNGLLKTLLTKTEFKDLPAHLKKDAYKRMGLRADICPWTEAISFFDCGGEQIEITGQEFVVSALAKARAE